MKSLSQGTGVTVDTADQADTIFSVEDGVTPFDIEQIMAEYVV
ncbi:hypothetical protein J14TS5_58160 [Paenibacillus lautus]|nr:hypothetical protein [Paenibacillus lautus]GIP00731.1 hypothetical protein J14TS5_58160 [Paenibacillus lautus]